LDRFIAATKKEDDKAPFQESVAAFAPATYYIAVMRATEHDWLNISGKS
jgi:hypothetical protein